MESVEKKINMRKKIVTEIVDTEDKFVEKLLLVVTVSIRLFLSFSFPFLLIFYLPNIASDKSSQKHAHRKGN